MFEPQPCDCPEGGWGWVSGAEGAQQEIQGWAVNSWQTAWSCGVFCQHKGMDLVIAFAFPFFLFFWAQSLQRPCLFYSIFVFLFGWSAFYFHVYALGTLPTGLIVENILSCSWEYLLWCFSFFVSNDKCSNWITWKLKKWREKRGGGYASVHLHCVFVLEWITP